MTRRILCALLLVICISPAFSQVNSEKYRGLFLVGEFGEICTMCEVTILCETGNQVPTFNSIPSAGSFTLYHLQTRTFWSQIATIWEWFIANFNSESLAPGHSRPVKVYAVESGTWSGHTTIEAQIALEPPVLTLGEHLVDRTNQAWMTAGDAIPLGYCQRMPLWDSLDIIEQNNGGGIQP